MQPKDEAELIAQSLDGNHDAYAELIDRYKSALYHHCFAIVRREDVAEDLVQDTFITVYYKLRLYKSKYKFSTWLFKVSTNKALNYLKKAAHEIAADDELIASIASQHVGPLDQAKDAELHAAVQNLEPKYRVVISLYYWQGMNYHDIGRILGAPDGSIKGWMNRESHNLKRSCREKFRQSFDG